MDKDREEIQSLNRTIGDIDLSDLTVEELEQRLEMAVAIPQIYCVINDCKINGHDCIYNGCSING